MKKITVLLRYQLIFVLSFFILQLNAIEQWTAIYRNIIDRLKEQDINKSVLAFAKNDVLQFTQLIFSWNIKRPSNGFFSFFVSARDANTKNWYPWHKMADWGNGVQQSYKSEFSGSTGYHHVRLELPRGKKADAFRIKIIANKGASFSLLRGVYVCVSDMDKFASEINDRSYMQLPSVYAPVETRYSQMKIPHIDADRMCSPTSSCMLMSYLCKNQMNPLQFAVNVYDKGLDSYGNWLFNVAQAYQGCSDQVLFYVERLHSFARMHQLLTKKIPIVVSVRGPLPGSFGKYSNGHLLLVVGWDRQNKTVICHDPAAPSEKNVLTEYRIKDFLTSWERSRRLAYIAQERI